MDVIDQYAKIVPNGLMWVDGYVPQTLHLGDIVRVKVTVPRNGGHHRKAFVLLNELYSYYHEWADSPVSFEVFRKWMTRNAGFFDVAPDGSALPKSISYNSMDQEEFSRLYNSLITFAIGSFLPEVVTREELTQQIDNILLGYG